MTIPVDAFIRGQTRGAVPPNPKIRDKRLRGASAAFVEQVLRAEETGNFEDLRRAFAGLLEYDGITDVLCDVIEERTDRVCFTKDAVSIH